MLVWRPPGKKGDRLTVVYVHGYGRTVDQAVKDHKLVEKFTASGLDATFIVPEAPSSNSEGVSWPDLGALLQKAGASLTAPVAAVGHSGAYRTIAKWLDFPRLVYVALLDALYANEAEFTNWAQTHRMTLIGAGDTGAASARVAYNVGGLIASFLPARWSRVEMQAPVVYAPSPYSHHQMVVEDGPILAALGRIGEVTATSTRTWWPWLLGGVVIIGGATAGYLVWRRRRYTTGGKHGHVHRR